jgi:hypothetical protein
MMRRLKQWVFVALLASVFAGLAVPAIAGNWHFRGYNIRTFHRYDFDAWRHGYWYHGWRGGRFAWWWFGGGLWYPYAAPIYPYPNPYIPPTVIVQPAPQPSRCRRRLKLGIIAQTRRATIPMFPSAAFPGRPFRRRRNEGDKT